MRTLGVDPGSVVTGYGVVDGVGQKLIHVSSGFLKVGKRPSFPERLSAIYQGLTEIIDEHDPEVMAIESLFFSKNVKSAILLGHARGVAILAGVNAGLDIYEYSPLEIKQSVVGYGRADKGQVQEMIRILLSLKETPESNMADALAVAVCHLNTARSIQRIHSNQHCRTLCGQQKPVKAPGSR